MVFDTDGHFALLRAVSAGRPRQVRLLLGSGIGVNHTDANGQSPLIRSIFVENSRYRMKILRMLLRRGAVVAHRDCLGRSALIWACLRGQDCVVELFLKKTDGDINLNDSDVNDCTPLFHAATSGNAATTKLLVDALRRYDLSVDISNEDGITPLMQAIRLGNDVCASILLHQGKASVSIRDNNRRSALDWAEATRHIKTNFLPLIEKSKTERPKAGKSGRRGRIISVSSMNDSDSSDNESRYSNDILARDGIQLDGDDMSVCSDDKSLSSCSSSQTSSSSSSCDSSPETIKRMFCRTPLSSCKDSSCPCLADDSDVSNNDLTKKQLQPDQKHHLPQLYQAYAIQLTDTFRPGYQPTSTRPPSASGDSNHDNCQLECCTTEKGIDISEEKLLKVVQANRKQRENISKQNSGSRKSLFSKFVLKFVFLRKRRLIFIYKIVNIG